MPLPFLIAKLARPGVVRGGSHHRHLRSHPHAAQAPHPPGWLGPLYGIPATASGIFITVRAFRFLTATDDRNPAAQRLFLSTVQTLPFVMLALVGDAIFS